MDMRRNQDDSETLASYVEIVRQFLAARKCVNQVFNPADERLAAQLFREHVALKQIERGVCSVARGGTMALLNGTAVGPISGLKYFSSTLRRLEFTALRMPAPSFRVKASMSMR